MNPLIVFHSRTGYTRRVAEELAGECNGAVDEVCRAGERRGLVGYLGCAFEARTGRTPVVLPVRQDPARFELVLLGTPVWAWSLSSPVRTYLREHGRHLKRVAFFCTMAAAGADNAFSEMQALCGKVPLATLVLTDRELEARSHGVALSAFVKALG